MSLIAVSAAHFCPTSLAQTPRKPDERPVGTTAGTPGVRPSAQNNANTTLGSRPPPAAGAAKTDAIGRLADKDGMVSRERFTRLMAERFDAADAKKKGAIPVEAARRLTREVTQ
ncbi:MAG TPA: hypothetical protein VNE58_12595 [Casimicrobiaceae bacterium]|nr:hypothetical protein [Casimicrobiaceae bacterium]